MTSIWIKLAAAVGILMTGAAALADGTDQFAGCVIAGREDAPLTIEEFVDFNCPYCVTGARTMNRVLESYPNKVKLVLRNMPLPFHAPNSTVAAKAFIAVWLQGKDLAYAFQSELFEHQDQMKRGETFLFETAIKVGADLDRLKRDMNGSVVAKILEKDQRAAQALGFSGTPSFLIGSESVTGSRPYEDLKVVIDRQLGSN
jgi:protein-disulfide isomerase